MTQFDDNPYADNYAAPERESNPLGVVGFVLSILCITSPLGLLISMIALFKRPRGFAIAGVIIGILFSVIIGFFAWMALVFGGLIGSMIEVAVDLEMIQLEVEEYTRDNQAPPNSLSDLGWTKQDPWGNDYIFALDDDTGVWTLTVVGPDGTLGTGDDLVFDSEMSDADVQGVMSDWAEENAEDIVRDTP